jgi:tetratricopeptide (TPR) repeat protein
MERVVRVCRESLRFHPRHAVFHTILGAAYHVQEEYEAAEAELEIVLAMNPSDLYALYNRAIVLQAQGSPETVAAWEEYLRKSDGDAEHTAPLPDRPGGLSRRDIARAYYQQVKGDVPRR